MARMARMLFLLCSVALIGDYALAATYYVDIANGADTNPGTSKAAAWAHAPGMQTCSAICATTSIKPGDSIILRGGETWPNASFEWSLPSGSSGNPVYVGVDKTWYVGSSWLRPVLSANGAVITNHYDTMFSVGGWVTLDGVEITGFYWTASACSGAPFGDCGFFNVGQHDGFVLENTYIHGWTHAGTGSTSSSGVVDIWGGQGGLHCSAHDNVISGTDVPGDHSVNAFFSGPITAYNNYIQQVSSAFIVNPLGQAGIYHDNYIYDVGPAYCNENPYAPGNCTHENAFEDNGDTGLYFYNNVIANTSMGLAMWIAPNPGYSAYMWNNVVYSIHDNQVLDMAPPVYNSTYCPQGKTGNGYCLAAGRYYLWNNTVECGDDTTQYDVCQDNVGKVGSGSVATLVDFENNHFISASTAQGCATGSGAALSCTFASSNVVQTISIANGQGFTSSEEFPFSPTTSPNATTGVGTNLTNQASGALATLTKDTTDACAVTSGELPLCPQRLQDPRPPTGAWNAGAYQGLNPGTPLNLTGSVVTKP